MGKRNLRNNAGSDLSGRRVEVIMEDLSSHPRCPHGPTLLFSGGSGEFFACASCRGRECSVRVPRSAWEDPRVRRSNAKFHSLIASLDKAKSWRKLRKLRGQEVGYCETCDEVYAATSREHSAHATVSPLSAAQLAAPSAWLPPLDRDTREAQYMFSRDSIDTIVGLLDANHIRNVVCMGTPSIHEALQSRGRTASVLLDVDARHRHFHAPDAFLRYNMFNHHFFDEEDSVVFDKFLQKSLGDGSLCVVLDPPFGGRVEPIAHTLNTIGAHCRRSAPRVPLHVVWAFPYFSEPYITNLLPALKMHDYHVTYTNHPKFKAGSSSRTPVRLFTSLPLGSLWLAGRADYKWCDRCAVWVSRGNSHCDACGACTGKNGAAYRHCAECHRCVKRTYAHCAACGRCSLKQHVCGLTIHVQSCYNCKEKGHKRVDCPLLRDGQEPSQSVHVERKRIKRKKK